MEPKPPQRKEHRLSSSESIPGNDDATRILLEELCEWMESIDTRLANLEAAAELEDDDTDPDTPDDF